MGVPIHNPVRGNGVERRSVAISFFPNGSSDPVDWQDPNGDVEAVSREGQSSYKVTLNYPVQKILSCNVTVQLASGADAVGQVGATSASEGSGANLEVPIALLAGGSAAAEVAANADNRVHVQLELELSSVNV